MNLATVKDPRQWTLGPNTLLRRILVAFFGVVIVSVGIAISLEGMVGVDPFAAFLQGLSHLTGISFTWIVPLINLIMLFLIVIPFDRSIFGIGTILNMTLVGFFTDTFRDVYQHFYTFEYSVGGMLAHLVIGLVFFCLGVSMQICPRLGTIPYDGIAPSLHRKFPRYSYRTYRTIQDIVTILIAGILIGFDWSLGILGVGTIIMGFFIGVFVDFFNRTFTNKILGIKGDVLLEEKTISEDGASDVSPDSKESLLPAEEEA